MKSFLNWFATGFAAFFSIPTLLIMITWNALPGDRLYSLKTSLEDVALFVTLRTPIASTLTIKYTQRRFSEANILLSKKGSTIGYSLLVAQTQASKKVLVDKNDSRKAEELVTKIEEYQKQIEQKQEAIKTGDITIPVAQTTITSPKTPSPAPPPSTPPPTPSIPSVITPAEDEEQVIDELEKVKEELEKVKEDIKRELPAQASDRAKEKHKEKGD